MNDDLMLIYDILVDFDNRNPTSLFFPGDLRENDGETSDVLGLIAKIWDISDTLTAMKSDNNSLSAIATEAEKILNLSCNFNSKVYEVTDNIIVEKFDAQPNLLDQLLDGVDSAIASLVKYSFTDEEIPGNILLQANQVIDESDKVIKQNPNEYDYQQLRIESSNAEDIIKFDGGLEELLEYAKSLLMRKTDWYIHLIAVKVKRILDSGCKYENNRITRTDDKLICTVVEGDFTAIVNKPTDLLKKLVDWKVKEYGKEEGDPEIEDREDEGNTGGSKKLDCRDFPVNAQYTRSHSNRTAILAYVQLGKPQSRLLRTDPHMNSVMLGISSYQNGTKLASIYMRNHGNKDVEEMLCLPLSFNKDAVIMSYMDRVIKWSNGRHDHEERHYTFNARNGAIAKVKKPIMFINLRLPGKGKFAYYKQEWDDYAIDTSPWTMGKPSRKHSLGYTPSGDRAAPHGSRNGVMGTFTNVTFPGAVFIIPRLRTRYYQRQGHSPYIVDDKTPFLLYASSRKVVTTSNGTATQVETRRMDYTNGRVSPSAYHPADAYRPHTMLLLGSTEPLIEAYSYNQAIKPRIRLYSDLGGEEFLCCSHDEDREIFNVDFSKSKLPYNTVTASNLSKFSEYGQFGFTYVQVHLPPDKQNVYPLVEHVYTNGTGVSFRLWDARTGQELKERFPISVLSVQHH